MLLNIETMVSYFNFYLQTDSIHPDYSQSILHLHTSNYTPASEIKGTIYQLNEHCNLLMNDAPENVFESQDTQCRWIQFLYLLMDKELEVLQDILEEKVRKYPSYA